MNGILLINKPKGLSSHDVVYKIKKKLNISKVGHTGTLDPFATGLLIILLGNATKLAFMFDGLDKSYEGTVVFGKLFDTLDTTGKVLDEKSSVFDLSMIEDTMKSFMPSYSQMPPDFSAIKKNGIKAYELARSGQTVVLEPRIVNVYDFNVISYNEKLQFNCHVSKGTYIRSLAKDLGEKLGSYGALESLNRTKIGNYDLKAAKLIEDVSIDDVITDVLLFDQVRTVKLNDYMVKLVLNGVYLDERQTLEKTPFVVIDSEEHYIAYYELVEDHFEPKYFFKRLT